MEKLEIRPICSAFDGVVVKRDFSPGEYIQDKFIMVIAPLTRSTSKWLFQCGDTAPSTRG